MRLMRSSRVVGVCVRPTVELLPLPLQSGLSERITELSRMESTFLLSEALRREFETRTYIPMSRLAKLLPMAPKTLAEHVRKGNIDWRRKGFGEKRPRRVFTQPDVVAFLQRIIAKSEASCLTDDPGENVVDRKSVV